LFSGELAAWVGSSVAWPAPPSPEFGEARAQEKVKVTATTKMKDVWWVR